MPEPILNYHSPKAVSTRHRLAAWLSRGAWICLALVIAGIIVFFIDSRMEWNSAYVGLLVFAIVALNICGGLSGLISCILKPDWVANAAFTLHVLIYFPFVLYVAHGN